MSIRTAEHEAPAALRVSLPLCAAAACYALLLALGGRLLNDPDIYWHVTVGRWVVAQRAFPHVDVFSHTMAGAPWIAKEWLAQILYAGTFGVAGWAGVVVLAAAAIATAFGLLAHFLLRKLAPVPALTLVGAAFVLAAPHLLARPHALALPLMVLWIAVLVNAVERGGAPPLALLPVMTLWVNLHGSFILGLALIAPLALEAWWNAGPARRQVAIQWIRFAALALLAACVTPYGPETIAAAYRVLSLGQAMAIIIEWQPADFSKLDGFEGCLLLGLGFVLYRGVVLPPLRIAVLLGLLHLALSHSRNTDVVGLLAPLFLAQPLARSLGPPADADPQTRARTLFDSGLVAILAALTFALAPAAGWSPRAQISPAGAVAAIEARSSGPIFNDYDFGGFLINAGVKPFIDGRAELYGEAFIMRHHRAVTLQDVGDFVRLLDEHRIAVTLLSPATPAVGLLDRMDEWQRVYADGIAVVHARRAAP